MNQRLAEGCRVVLPVDLHSWFEQLQVVSISWKPDKKDGMRDKMKELKKAEWWQRWQIWRLLYFRRNNILNCSLGHNPKRDRVVEIGAEGSEEVGIWSRGGGETKPFQIASFAFLSPAIIFCFYANHFPRLLFFFCIRFSSFSRIIQKTISKWVPPPSSLRASPSSSSIPSHFFCFIFLLVSLS